MNKISRVLLCGALVTAFCFLDSPARADSIGIPRPGPTAGWPQSGGPGSEVILTYSYSNLLDGTFLLLSPEVLRAATEEALGLWASYAPLRFVEQVDAGPAPSAESYASGATPQIRIGHQAMAELAFGYFPGDGDGLAGDIHFDSDTPWALNGGPWNFLEALTHELGHALGLGHETERPGLMNPFHPRPFYGGLGSAYLTPADIEAIQARYGVGVGSVQPLESNPVPEPATVLCVGAGLVVLARRRLALRRGKRRELEAGGKEIRSP